MKEKIEFEFAIYEDKNGEGNILTWRKDYVEFQTKYSEEFVGFRLNDLDGLKFIGVDEVKDFENFENEELSVRYTGRIKVELDGEKFKGMDEGNREKLRDVIELIAEYYVYPEC